MLESALEETAMLDSFASVAERWLLSGEEVGWLLASMDEAADFDFRRARAQSETAMRLIIELDSLLRMRMTAEEITEWLRHEDVEGPDPLTFMAQGLTYLRALVQAARLRRDLLEPRPPKVS